MRCQSVFPTTYTSKSIDAYSHKICSPLSSLRIADVKMVPAKNYKIKWHFPIQSIDWSFI